MITPQVIYRDNEKHNHSWARWLVARTFRKNQNNLVAVVGPTGSGKTWSAISICEIMEKMDGVPFTIDHIVFSLTELMELINSGTLKKGSKIVFDEPQVSISAKEFLSEANKIFNYLLSTFRHRNFSLFFCTPFETLLDKSSRKLFHMRIQVVGVNSNKNTCRVLPYFLEHSEHKDRTYRKSLSVIQKNPIKKGYKVSRVGYWDIPKPSNDIIELYEKKKREFTDNLNQNITERLKRFEAKGKSMTMKNVKDPLDLVEIPLRVKDKIAICLSKGMTNIREIAKESGTSYQNAINHVRKLAKPRIALEILTNVQNQSVSMQEEVKG